MAEKIKFVFKGNRDYVHGTSLFNSLVHAARERGCSYGRINVSFKKMIRSPLCLLEQREPTANDTVVAKILGPAGRELSLVLNEVSEEGVVERQEFDESKVCHGAVVGDNRITQIRPHHENLIELLVSLCKRMHQECLDTSKKWVFSRYDGQFPIPEPEKVELAITKRVGTRLTCSDVFVNDKQIGNVYFS